MTDSYHVHTHEHPGMESYSHGHDYPESEQSCHGTRRHTHSNGITHSHPHVDRCLHAKQMPFHRRLSELPK